MSSARPAALQALPGTVAVAATYAYFLLFAQFGFLGLLQSRVGSDAAAVPVMIAMGLGGLLSSLATALMLKRRSPQPLLQAGFVGCAATALLAIACTDVAGFAAVAALIGISTGALTVSLATELRRLVGWRGFASKVGLATGVAYMFCNLPGVFDASPRRQAVLSAVICLAGFTAVRLQRDLQQVAPQPAAALSGPDYRGLGFASIVLAFLALVWIDSAAFVVIQETPGLKGLTWGGPTRTLLIGSCHLMAAIAAGRLIDRGLYRSLLFASFALFVLGFALLASDTPTLGFAGPVYALGISTYSVALVVYPSLHGDRAGLVPARWRAGVVYGLCGWIGSAMGIGMAQDLHEVPRAFLWLSGGVLLGGALLAHRRAIATLIRVHAITLAMGLVAVLLYVVVPGPVGAHHPSDGEAPVERGRQVYVAEGCINCHSQYVRPGTHDELWWGPSQPLAPGEQPLIGVRRQGPDLSAVGNRRSPEWQRLHLKFPRGVSPGSRMPSYAYLFESGDSRGEDLVAYLSSLGAESAVERFEMTQNAPLGTAANDGRIENGAEIFGRSCAPCHGVAGRGNGETGRSLRRPSMNLRKDDFWLVSWGPDSEPEQAAVARLVRFGVSGTSMAGHEYFTDREVADVAAYVRSLRGTDEGDRKGRD